MTGGIRAVVGWGIALLLTAGVALQSRFPAVRDRDQHGVIRLAWSARPERIEICRVPTAEEQAGLAVHMRQAKICEGTTAPYRVTLDLDGATVLDEPIHGAGLRHDRAIYYFREVETAPGVRRIGVHFVRADDQGQLAPLDTTDRRRPVPRALALDTTLTIPVRGVLLVTYHPEGQRLVLRTSEQDPPW